MSLLDSNNKPLVARVAACSCGSFSCAIILVRLFVSRYQPKPLDGSFQLACSGLLAIIAFTIVDYFALDQSVNLGNNTEAFSNGPAPAGSEEAQLKLASILTLVTRVLAAYCILSMKSLCLQLQQKITAHVSWVKYAATTTWMLILAAFLATVLCVALECRPINLYWQIYPSPGYCGRAYKQTLVLGAGCAIIDLMLVAISVPIFFIHGSQIGHKLRTGGLVILNAVSIAATIVGVIMVCRDAYPLQPTRSLWAAVNIFLAAVIANAPVIFGALRLRFERRRDSIYGYVDGVMSPRRAALEFGSQDFNRFSILKETTISLHHENMSSNDDYESLRRGHRWLCTAG